MEIVPRFGISLEIPLSLDSQRGEEVVIKLRIVTVLPFLGASNTSMNPVTMMYDFCVSFLVKMTQVIDPCVYR